MEGLEYLLVEPACEVNEKGTRGNNDGNEDVSLDDNEKIEAGSDAESFAEKEWNDPEQAGSGKRDGSQATKRIHTAGITDLTVWIGPRHSGPEGIVSTRRHGPSTTHSREYRRVRST